MYILQYLRCKVIKITDIIFNCFTSKHGVFLNTHKSNFLLKNTDNLFKLIYISRVFAYLCIFCRDFDKLNSLINIRNMTG